MADDVSLWLLMWCTEATATAAAAATVIIVVVVVMVGVGVMWQSDRCSAVGFVRQRARVLSLMAIFQRVLFLPKLLFQQAHLNEQRQREHAKVV